MLTAVLLAVGALIAGSGWALSSPAGSSPDDDYHLPSIWCAPSMDSADCRRDGVSPDGDLVVRVPALVAQAPCFAYNPVVTGACQAQVLPEATATTDRVNTGDYPSGYYRVMHVFVQDDVGEAVVTMRIFNVALAVVLFALLALAGSPATRRLQVYSLTCVLVPLGWFVIASVNPSGWATTGVTAFGFGLHSFLVVGGRRRRVLNAVLALVGLLMAVSARGDAAIYVVLVAGCVSLVHWRTFLRDRRLLALPVVSAAIGAVLGLTSGQVSGVAGQDVQSPRATSEVMVNLALEFPALVGGIFGYGAGLGWLDTPISHATAFPVLVVVGFLALSGAGRGHAAKVMAVLALGGAMLAIPLLTLYRAHMVVGEAVQPRYLLPLAPILLFLLMTGRTPDTGLGVTRGQAIVIFVLLTVANAAALYVNLRRYVTGTDGVFLHSPQEWWWSVGPSPLATWLLGSLGFACFAAAVVVVSGRQRDDGSSPLRLGRSGGTGLRRR